MKVVAVAIEPRRVRLARPITVRAAAPPITVRRSLLVRLSDGEGQVGQGEAAPLPGVSRDTVEVCERELRALDWSALQRSAGGDSDGTAPLEAVAEALAALDLRSPAARFAVETALLDLAGQRLGRPLAALLAGSGTPRLTLPLSAIVDGTDAAAAASAAERAVERGASAIKYKIGRGGAFALELDVARAIARAVGPAIALRLDGNQSFSIDEAPARLAALAALEPEYVEEPVQGGLDARLVHVACPLAADESLTAPAALGTLEALVAVGRLRALVLKPTVLGGALPCLALARWATARGVALVVTHTWDGAIAMHAATALALALPGEVLACGLDAHGAMGLEDPPSPSLARPRTHGLVLCERPGLGLP